MPRRDVSFTIALSTSLLAHGTLGLLIVQAYAEREAFRLAAFDRPMWINLDGESLLPIGLWDSALPAAAELPPDAPASPLASIQEPPPPPLTAQPPPPPPTPDFRPPMGDDLGGGQAIGRVDGDRPQQARQADQDQPALTREAPGLPEPSLASNPSPAAPPSPAQPTPPASPAPPTPADPTEPSPSPDRGGAEGFLRNVTGRALPDREDPSVAPQDPAPPRPRLGAEQGSPLPPVPEPPRNRRPLTTPNPAAPDSTAAGTADQPRPDNVRPADTARDTPGTTPQPPTPDRTAPSAQSPDNPADDRPLGTADQPRTDPTTPPSPATPPTPPGAGLPQQPPPSPPTPDPSRLPPPAPEPTAPEPAPAPPLPQGTDTPEARPDGVQSPPSAPRPDDNPALPPPAPGTASLNTTQAPNQAQPAPSAADPQTPSTPSPASAAVPPGEPRTRSDREADPFSRVGSIAFTPGRVDARLGRQVRWVRPRLTMAGQLDAASTRNSAVGMAVTIDATGRVTYVRVLESSGFPDTIDLPVVRAVYSWWFEPLKNAAGDPQPDTLLIRVVIRN